MLARLPRTLARRARGVKRSDLVHILRAAATIADERDVLVIGSQAILGTLAEDDLPTAATRSMEADVAFFDDGRRNQRRPTSDLANARSRLRVAIESVASTIARPGVSNDSDSARPAATKVEDVGQSSVVRPSA